MPPPAAPTLPTGPAIGAPFPAVTLLDQSGAPVTVAAARPGTRAMVVLYRSAAW